MWAQQILQICIIGQYTEDEICMQYFTMTAKSLTISLSQKSHTSNHVKLKENYESFNNTFLILFNHFTDHSWQTAIDFDDGNSKSPDKNYAEQGKLVNYIEEIAAPTDTK